MSEKAPKATTMAAVIIGRNEGERLVRCLDTVVGAIERVVYVDSGSTDDSVAVARTAGARVVQLDMSLPFTAARARNKGIEALQSDQPSYVQFIDGDCELRPGWLAESQKFLDTHSQVAIACGRLRERFPGASTYNRLCDWEWDTPIGLTKACGGIALVRWTALRQVGDYRNDLIAAEDDELCVRLRSAGWQIWRLDAEMALHDAAMFRFGQWWRRAVRAGYGFAQVGALHPGYFTAQRWRMWIWGGLLPLVALAGLFIAPVVTFGVAVLYALSFLRVSSRFLKGGLSLRETLACAGLITLSKTCNLQGALTYWARRLSGKAASIIEYK